MAFKPIEILINAKDNASSVFGKVQAAAGALGTAVLAYFGVNAFAGVVKGAANFEEALSRVQSATDATAAEMVDLRKAAEAVGAEGSFSSVQAAEALENLAKAGLSAGDAIKTLPAVMALAKTENIALGTSAEFVTKVVMGMGLAFDDAGRVADVLAKGAKSTNTSVVGLAQAMSYAAPLANSLGLSLEFTVAMMGQFAQGGIDASRAGTALNSILSQFSDPASKFRTELAAAGITTIDFEKALHQLAAAGPAGQKAILAVGQEAGPALRVLLNQGMGALDQLSLSLKNAEGSAAAAAAVMTNNLNGSLTALGNVWQYVKDTLATPVLPVLREGVDALAGALRAAVADGSVGKFGEAIALAFKNGIQAIKEFLGTVDFTAVIARMQQFAADANDTLQKVGEYATNAGNTVKLAYGVMSAGTNAVLVGIYGVGSAFAEMASVFMEGVVKLREGLATVTFGELSKSFELAAEDARNAAQGFGDAAQAMRDKAKGALDDVASAAQLAQEGYLGLSTQAKSSASATTAAAQATASLATELKAGAEAAAKAGAAYQKKANDDQLAKQSAIEHAAAIKQLRAEYDELVARGSLQGAAEKLKEINKALAGTPPASKAAAKAAADAAAAIEAAFKDLGVTTDAELKKVADRAKGNFDLLANSGKASARELSDAFIDAAEKAIAANNGIAPSWVSAQAGVRGYRIEVDAAGKSHLELINKAGPGLDRLAKGWQASREAIEAQEDAMAKLMLKYTMSANYTERQIALLEREAAAAEKAAEAYRKKWNMDKEGYSLNTAGERINQGETQDQVDKDVARRYGQQNVENADAQRARQLAVMLGYLAQQGGQIRDPGTAKQIADMRRELQELEVKLLNTAPAKPEGGTTATAPSAPPASGPVGGSSRSGGSGMGRPTSTVVFNLKSGPQSIEDMTPNDVNVINTVIQELARGKGTAR